MALKELTKKKLKKILEKNANRKKTEIKVKITFTEHENKEWN